MKNTHTLLMLFVPSISVSGKAKTQLNKLSIVNVIRKNLAIDMFLNKNFDKISPRKNS